MFFIDVQGTLISDKDKTPLKGSLDFIASLNKKKLAYMIVTNNTKKPSYEFYQYLRSLGFEFDFSSYIDPLMILESCVSKQNVAAYGSKAFLKTIKKMGYKLEYEKPKSVLIAIKEDFVADEYAQIIDFLLNGADLIGMNETSIYAQNSKRYPGVGGILKMLEFCSSSPYRVVGKPSFSFYSEALKKLKKQDPDAEFSKITMISDDVKGDLGGAKELGMKTLFVLSGKYKTQKEIVPFLKQELQPDEIYENMQEILEQNEGVDR